MSNQRAIDSYYSQFENPAVDEPEEIEPVVITSAQYKAFLDLLDACVLAAAYLSDKRTEEPYLTLAAAIRKVKGQS